MIERPPNERLLMTAQDGSGWLASLACRTVDDAPQQNCGRLGEFPRTEINRRSRMFGLPQGALALAYTPWILTLLGGVYLGLCLVRSFERRSAARAEIAALEERMLRLEETTAAMNDRLEGLTEGQEFTSRLLSDRK